MHVISRQWMTMLSDPITKAPTKSIQITKKRQLYGLRNRQNFCFINSSLQCLLSTVPLFNYVTNAPSFVDKTNKDDLIQSFSILCNLFTLKQNATYVDPENIINSLKNSPSEIARKLIDGHQQDASEFVYVFCESLLKSIKNQAIAQLFALHIIKEFKCLECEKVTVDNITIQNKISLNLVELSSLITEINITSLLEEISFYTMDKRICSCNNKPQSVRYTIIDWPTCLVIQLERSGSVKSEILVQYDEFLTIPLNLTDNKVIEYKLYGVVLHSSAFNSTTCGHYQAQCNIEGSWYSFSDQKQVEIKNPIKASENATILFYQKV